MIGRVSGERYGVARRPAPNSGNRRGACAGQPARPAATQDDKHRRWRRRGGRREGREDGAGPRYHAAAGQWPQHARCTLALHLARVLDGSADRSAGAPTRRRTHASPASARSAIAYSLGFRSPSHPSLPSRRVAGAAPAFYSLRTVPPYSSCASLHRLLLLASAPPRSVVPFGFRLTLVKLPNAAPGTAESMDLVVTLLDRCSARGAMR